MSSRPRSASTDELLAHASFLRRLCRELVGDAHAADDLAQETMVVALERPPLAAGSIAGWLATVARNLARNARRGRMRRVDRELTSARAEQVEGEQLALECIEIQQQIFDQLLMLPVDQRTVLYLRYYEGLSPNTIAVRLRVPVKTIKSRHTRALAALRERLDARSHGDRTRWMAALVPVCAPRGIHSIGAAWKTVCGGLAVKKMLVALGVVLLAALGWWMWTPRVGTTLSAVSHKETPELARQAPELTPTLAVAARSDQRDPVAVPSTSTLGSIEVRLLWSDGTAAADIGLDLVCAGDPSPREESVRSVTDADGVAIVSELHPGSIKITPDMRERFESEVQAGVTRKVTHTLEAGVEITGRVVDNAGVAVANASIWCRGALWYRSPDMKHACDCAADGTFVLRDVAPRATFGARARGYRPSLCFTAEALPATAPGKRSIELQLGESGGRVNGIVLDPDGNPLEHARVLAGGRGGFQVDTPARIRGVAPYPATAETGKDGRFELLDDIEPGKQPIYATARGFPIWEGSVAVVRGASASVEIRLSRSARIAGRVLGLDGNVVAGVQVIAAVEDRGGWYWSAFPAAKCLSGEQGEFVVDWVHPGKCELNASDSQRSEIGRAHALVECTADQTTNFDLRLERGHVIAGRVEDQDGVPISGWLVNSEGASFSDQLYPRQARTAADGSFTLLNVGGGKSNLTVRAPLTVVERARANSISAGTSGVVLVVKNAREQQGTLQGRIVDPSGRVLDDVIVTLWKAGGRAGEFIDFDLKSGRFRDLHTAGRYRLSAMRGNRTLLTTDEFAIAGGEVSDLGDLVFPALGALEITLVFPPSIPFEAKKQLEKLRLGLIRESKIQDETLRAHDGVWSAEDLLPGRWLVEMHESEFCIRGAEVDVREGVTTRIDLSVEFAVNVQIAFANHGQTAFTVEARDDAGKLLRLLRMDVNASSDESVIRIGLPVGRAKIEIRADDGSRSGQLDVEVTRELLRGKPLHLDLR